MTPSERDQIAVYLLKWRLVLKHATTARVKEQAAQAIRLLERKMKDTPSAGGGWSQK